MNIDLSGGNSGIPRFPLLPLPMEDRIAAAAPALLSKIVVDVDMGKDEGEGEENDAIEDGHDATEDRQDADDDVMDNGEDAQFLQEPKIAPAGDDQRNEELPVGVSGVQGRLKHALSINGSDMVCSTSLHNIMSQGKPQRAHITVRA